MATKVSGTIERFEQAQLRALDAHRESPEPTLPPDLTPVGLKAAAQRRFAQIWWSARYPHGQHATPHVDVDGRIIRCRVDMSGTPEPDAGTDWTSFETKIDNLPPARYRIIAPTREVTLLVPEVFRP